MTREEKSLANLPFVKEHYRVKKKLVLITDGIYLLDIKNLQNPKLLNNNFKEKEHAARAIRQELNSKFSRFKIITGELAIKHGLLFKRHGQGLRDNSHVRNYKYAYPPDRLGDPKRMKYYRDMQSVKRKKARLKLMKANENNNIQSTNKVG